MKTNLPNFNGFYGSYFEDAIDNTIECIWDREEVEIDADIDVTNYPDLERGWIDIIIIHVKNAFKEVGIKFTDVIFETIDRPRQYNFVNDTVTVNITGLDVDNIRELLIPLYKGFQDSLRNDFTDYDGFVSYYSNDAEEWLKWLDRIELKSDDYELEIGYILEFLIANLSSYDKEVVIEEQYTFISENLDYTIGGAE